MKPLFKLEINISGYRFVLNQYIVQYLEPIYLREKKYAVSEKFIQSLVIKIGKHIIYADGRHGMMT